MYNHAVPYIHFISIFYATNDVLRSFVAFKTKNRPINMCYDAK